MSHTCAEIFSRDAVGLRRPEDYNNRGVLRRIRGDLAGALADFERALALRPDYAESLNNRGVARLALGDVRGSLADFEAALRITPEYAEAYGNRGSARHAAGDSAGSIADFDRAVAIKPGYAEGYHNRGMARQEIGDTAGALADFDRAVAIGTPAVAAAALRGRGGIRLEHGDVEAALGDYDLALAIDPRCSDGYHGRGGARLALGDFDGAVADFDRALEFEPDVRATLISRGNAHYHRRDGLASADYKAAFRLDAEATARELVGIVVDHGRRSPRSVLDNCRKHLRIDPRDIMAYARRGLTLLLLGHDAEAEPDFERMRQLDPEWSPFLDRLIEGVRERKGT